MDCPGKLFPNINWIIKNGNVQPFNVSRQAWGSVCLARFENFKAGSRRKNIDSLQLPA